MRKLKATSTSNINVLISIAILISIVIGSQALLSSYPSSIIITNNTKFSTTFTSISSNQITFTANQVQSISPGDVLPLKTGGYIKFKANQSQNSNIREALKYGRYQLNHVLLLESTLSDWQLNKTKSLVTNSPSQSINLKYSTSLSSIEVTTPLSRYYISFPPSSVVLITSDDSKILYKLYRIDGTVKVSLIGLYDSSIKFYQLTS